MFVRAGAELHLFNRERPIRVVKFSYESMFIAKCVMTMTTTYTADSSAVACSEEKFFFNFKNGMQRAVPSSSGQQSMTSYLIFLACIVKSLCTLPMQAFVHCKYRSSSQSFSF
ncbi:unnamed protein product [Haemonchus placei]|uniref:ZP domain-containing protein n=1 Tax=Haemonchus placei TaxID=6290 RepID=A0A0N4W7Y5_HAEPC|nr:unnamed protein product [Haemonchus placei]